MRKFILIFSCCVLILIPGILLADAEQQAEGLKATSLLPREQKLIKEGYRELKGEELRNMISGNTEHSGTGSYFYHSPEGTFKGKSGQSGKFFSGTWMINADGKICRNWNSQYVATGCSTLYINDNSKDIQWLDTDGRWYDTKFITGNFKMY